MSPCMISLLSVANAVAIISKYKSVKAILPLTFVLFLWFSQVWLSNVVGFAPALVVLIITIVISSLFKPKNKQKRRIFLIRITQYKRSRVLKKAASMLENYNKTIKITIEKKGLINQSNKKSRNYLKNQSRKRERISETKTR
jgi:MFS superfamily sulfate permease-like transporter